VDLWKNCHWILPTTLDVSDLYWSAVDAVAFWQLQRRLPYGGRKWNIVLYMGSYEHPKSANTFHNLLAIAHVYLMNVYLTGVHLTGVYLTGVHLWQR